MAAGLIKSGREKIILSSLFIASMRDGALSNDSDGEQLKTFEETLRHYYFSQHKFHINWTGIESVLLRH